MKIQVTARTRTSRHTYTGIFPSTCAAVQHALRTLGVCSVCARVVK